MSPLSPSELFHAVPPSEVLIEGTIQEYERGIEFFYIKLLLLNTDIFIVERILKFPFGLFVGRDDMICWSRIVVNFLDMALLTITRLATDTGEDLYTLLGFRNRLLALVQPTYQEQFRQLLRESKFDAKTRNLLDRANAIRDRQIAHFHREWAFQIPEESRVDFTDIAGLRDILNAQLDVLAFNAYHMMLPTPYQEQTQLTFGEQFAPDIEQALASIAQNSVLLNMPEVDPAQWAGQRVRLSDHQLSLLNKYRVRFGLLAA